MCNKRKVEVWQRGTWNKIHFGAIRIGQIFRLFEQGKDTRMEPVLNEDGGPWNKCTSVPYYHTDKNGKEGLAVEAEPISKLPVEITDE